MTHLSELLEACVEHVWRALQRVVERLVLLDDAGLWDVVVCGAGLGLRRLLFELVL